MWLRIAPSLWKQLNGVITAESKNLVLDHGRASIILNGLLGLPLSKVSGRSSSEVEQLKALS